MEQRARKWWHLLCLWTFISHGKTDKMPPPKHLKKRIIHQNKTLLLPSLRICFLGFSPHLKWSRNPQRGTNPASFCSHFTLVYVTNKYLYERLQNKLTAASTIFLPRVFGREEKVPLQNSALHKAFSPSPQRRWTSFILSTDLQIPLQLQSKEATHTLPA